MKKIISAICMTCLVLGALSACSTGSTIKNEVAPKTLSQDQQDIVDLLSSDTQEILLFDFQTEDTYNNVEFWVEIYEDGELIDRLAGMQLYNDNAEPLSGQCGVSINHKDGMTFSFSVSTNGSKYSHTGTPVTVDSALALDRGYGPITAPMEIEAGKEIVLYTSIFSANSIPSSSDQQLYIEQPELLSDYSYVQMIKCKFE